MPSLDKSLIAGLPLFQGLSTEQMEFALSHARSARYPRATAIFSQGETARSFFLLLSGHVRVVRTSPEGQQVVARYISGGELFGIAVTMGASAYPATAVAAVDCVVLIWPNAVWPQLQERLPTFDAGACRTIGTRLQETHDRVLEISSKQVEQRIARVLLRLLQQAGRTSGEEIAIDFPITRQDIAEMTGTTLFSVSRHLSNWESEGIMRNGRQKVIVTDPHQLTLIAENKPTPRKH
ncbi:Crp/Fnr family transcriptional regulator [Phyllobacterium phragmitis]|uniref:Crp/Fnr family transcriptional regulator n=1 Tax=Phyllobacterium phragmitis TaxID=2670329 RepID=A0A2S9IMU2_9HYPH|nr:Crp/Fnr family transcriptional regulator [Phyllobacterium phragmitis]PRD41851.1 Crp/Fnr family transcriptional regulator [Phyllobacterium phragmitis]